MSKRIQALNEPTTPDASPDPPAGPRVLWVLDHEGTREFPVPEEGTLRVGRDPSAEVLLAHSSVSRAHATLRFEGGRCWVCDLGSVNGVRVHGQRCVAQEPVEFSVGDLLELGQVRLLVLARAAVQPSSTEARRARDLGMVLLDPTMLRLYDLLLRVAVSNINVLVLGETGVGKELIAEALHSGSPRAGAPLVRVNCAALSPTLVEAELFGHERGAFTGADSARPGLLETAHGGTLFLDEVGELPLPLQAKLLRVLEDRQVLRVGAQRARPVDLRFVAATHRDLPAEITKGTFRRDLYYRLNGLSLTIPPLRQRVVEVCPLAEHFLSRVGSPKNTPLTPAVCAALEAHDWPGNVRELRNAMERAAIVAGPRALTVADLPEEVLAHGASAGEQGGTLRDELSALERRRIESALERTKGNQTHAALMLGIPRRTLVARLKELGIERRIDRRNG